MEIDIAKALELYASYQHYSYMFTFGMIAGFILIITGFILVIVSAFEWSGYHWQTKPESYDKNRKIRRKIGLAMLIICAVCFGGALHSHYCINVVLKPEIYSYADVSEMWKILKNLLR